MSKVFIKNFVNNKWVKPISGKYTQLTCPLTGEITSEVAMSAQQDVDAAVDAAYNALPAWKSMNRKPYLHSYLECIKSREGALANAITMEQGKTLADARGEMKRAIQSLEYACSQNGMGLSQGNTSHVASISKDMDMYGVRDPVGVCVGITPFNFPVMIPMWMFPMSLMLGNTFVLKPSALTPVTANLLVELVEECKFPPGVVNVVHGGNEAVNALITHPLVDAVSFVGGNIGGEHIYTTSTAHNKRVQCNMGAKNHAVVMPDANKDHVLESLVNSAFGAAGQRCMALSVAVFVGDSSQWIPDLVNRAVSLKLGNGLDPSVDIGPMITYGAKKRVHSLLDRVKEESICRILLDGSDCTVADHPNGNFIGPTILQIDYTGSHEGMFQSVGLCEEFFGPILTIVTVPDLEAAVNVVNRNAYGNGTAIFTTSGGNARKYREAVHVGQVGINVAIPVPLPMFSFTGSKKSFKGSHYFNGPSSIDFYTKPKTVLEYWPPVATSAIDIQKSAFFDNLV